MAVVTVVVNGHNYSIDCNDGEEPQLQKLGARVDAKVQEVVRMVGQIGDTRLLLMAAMLIADDEAAVKAKLETSERALADMQKANAQLQAHINDAESLAADKLEAAAGRVETVLQALSVEADTTGADEVPPPAASARPLPTDGKTPG